MRFILWAVLCVGHSLGQGNVGDYILQGLGQTQGATSASNTVSTTYANTSRAISSSARNVSSSATESGLWQACQNSWLSWSDAFTRTLSPRISVTTQYPALSGTYNATYGYADVYTTIGGIPHAHGTITATSSRQLVTNWTTYTDAWTKTITNDAKFDMPQPNCTIPFSACSTMWQSYFQSLGLPTVLDGATEPAITPIPSNRPRCAVSTVKSVEVDNSPNYTCTIFGSTVELFYWPTRTSDSAPAITQAMNASQLVTAVRGNFTFTSPDVYLSFDTLQAIDYTGLDTGFSWSIPLGATQTIFDGDPVGLGYEGPTFTNKIVRVDPTHLSSLLANLGPGVNTASAVDAIAHGGADYTKWIKAISGSSPETAGVARNQSYLIRQVDYAQLTQPSAENYYLVPNEEGESVMAKGCNLYGPHPECSTIFDGEYRARLLVPPEVRNLASEWANCGIPLNGVFDPPIALSEARSEVLPQAPTFAPAKATSTPARVNGPVSTSEKSAEPQPSVTDSLPTATNSFSTLGAPTRESSALASSSNAESDVQPAETQISGASPVSSDPPSSTAPTVESSDFSPAAPSPSLSFKVLSAPAESQGPQSSDPSPTPTEETQSVAENNDPSASTAVVAIGSQTFTIPVAQTPAPKEPDVSPAQETNALSVLMSAEHTEQQSGSPETTEQGSNDALSTPTKAVVVTMDGSTMLVPSPGESNNVVTIGSATLSPDGPVATIDGHEVSAASWGLVVDSQRVTYATAKNVEDQQGTPTAAAIITIGSSSMLVPSPSGPAGMVTFGSATLSPGGPATTINGQEVSAATNGIIVDSQLVSYSSQVAPSAEATASVAAVMTASGHTYSFYRASVSNAVVIDGETLSAGGPMTTIGDQVVTVASSGNVLAAPAASLGTASVMEVGSGTFVYGSQTLTEGGAARTISGQVVSAVASGVVIGSSTIRPAATESGESSSSSTGSSSGSRSVLNTPSRTTVASSPTSSGAASVASYQWPSLLGTLLLILFAG